MNGHSTKKIEDKRPRSQGTLVAVTPQARLGKLAPGAKTSARGFYRRREKLREPSRTTSDTTGAYQAQEGVRYYLPRRGVPSPQRGSERS